MPGIPYAVQQYRPATMECVLQSAIKRNVPADVLLAIGQQEAGREGMALKNKNGSFDLGRVGINTVHLAELAKYGIPPDVATYYLMYDGCYNYDMAAFLLQRHLANCKQDFWTCVANYHSATPDKNAAYKTRIIPMAREWRRYLSMHYNVKEIQK